MYHILRTRSQCREKAGSAGKIETIAVIAGSQRAGPRCRCRQWYRRVREIGAAPKGSRRTRLERTDERTNGRTEGHASVSSPVVYRFGESSSDSRGRFVVSELSSDTHHVRSTLRDVAWQNRRESHIFLFRYWSFSPSRYFLRQYLQVEDDFDAIKHRNSKVFEKRPSSLISNNVASRLLNFHKNMLYWMT